MWQTIGIIVIVALAVAYIAWYIRRRAKDSGGCAHCGMSEQCASPEDHEKPPTDEEKKTPGVGREDSTP